MNLPFAAFNKFSQEFGSAWLLMLRALKTNHLHLFYKVRHVSNKWECCKESVRKFWIALVINPALRRDDPASHAFLCEVAKRFHQERATARNFDRILEEDYAHLPEESKARLLSALTNSNLPQNNITLSQWLDHIQKNEQKNK